MRAIWSDTRKFQIWLEIETIACEAMARLGLIPKEDAAVIRKKGKFKFDEFGRAEERLAQTRERIRVGKLSGAVGTHAHLDPRIEREVCQKLGLRPATISTQIVQRDRHAEFLTTLALIASSIDRWATEFRHLQRTEVLEVEEFFSEGQKGSSAMPHKRNPITGERLSGLARVLRGNALAALENVALWHERDISHS